MWDQEWDQEWAVRRMPPQTGDLDELRALQRQLELLRRELILTSGDPSVAVPFPPWPALVGAVGLGVVGFFGLAAAAATLLGEAGLGYLAVGGPVGFGATVTLVVLWRRKVSPVERRRFGRNREARQHHQAVLARNAVLWEQLRPQPAPDLPLPPDRQPSRFALTMHVRRGTGADPEEALRALPPDVSPLRVWYLRHVGRGVLVTFLIVAVLLSFLALRIAVDVAG